MSMYQRGSVWWIEVRGPDGKRVRESSGLSDRDAAQRYHDKRVAEIRAGMIEQPTWDKACVRWFIERRDKRSLNRDEQIASWLTKYWSGRLMDSITDDDIRKVIEIKRDETTASNANHYLAFVRTLFNKSVEWGLATRQIKVKSYKVKSQRVRFLSEDEIARLMAELPHHLRVMVEFSLLTGLRRSNVTGLRWDRIDMKRKIAWVDGSDYKSGKNHAIPLGDRCVDLLLGELGKHQTYVFTYKGQKIADPNNTAWQSALKRAGISDFRWHDLRHTFASYHAMNGTPLLTLKALGGWQTLEMVNRYAHLSAEGARQYVSNGAPTGGVVIRPLQAAV